MPVVVHGAGSADNANVMTEGEFLGELPTVLTATRLSQPALESPVSTTVITRHEIEASGAREVAELFRLVPGFQVGYARANKPVVTYHGLADDFARRLQVLVDGRSVYTPIFGGVLWTALPVSVQDIDRIEIIRAPNAASYGPNSFSAIINIITRHSASQTGSTVTTTVGQRGQRDAFGRIYGNLDDSSYRVSVEHESDDGFRNQPDGRSLTRVSGRYDATPGDRNEILLKAGIESGQLRRGQNSAQPAQGETNVPRDQDIGTGFAQAKWTRNLGPSRHVSVQYYVNYNHWTDDKRFDSSNGFALPPSLGTVPNPSVHVDQNVESVRHDVELVYTSRVSSHLRVVAGAGARQDSVTSRWLFGTDTPQVNDLYRAFGHAEYQARPGTTLHAGALVEHNSLTGTETSPRIALVQRTAPYQRLRMSISYATRTPALFEQRQHRYFTVYSNNTPLFRYATDYTNGDLKSERMRAIELGYRIDPPGRHWGLDAKLFREDVDHLIVEVPSTAPSSPIPQVLSSPFSEFTNGFSGRVHGVEGQVQLYPAPGIDLRIWASRLFIDHVNAVSNRVRDDYKASIPPTTAGLLATYQLSPSRTLSLDYYHTSPFSWVDNGDTTRTNRLDLQYREDWPELSPSAFIAVRLDNVLGKYSEYDDSNVVDTRASLELGTTF